MKIKNTVFKFIIFVFAVSCAFIVASCAPREPDTDIIYTLNENGTKYILSHVGADNTEVIIPETYNGLPVTVIDDYAFTITVSGGCGVYLKSISLKKLFLPSSIKQIGDCAFLDRNDGGIESLYYSGTLSEWCDIEMGSTPVTAGTKFYLSGEFITEVKLPESVAEIKRNTFKNFIQLKKIILHDGLTKINCSAFFNSGLEYVQIPNSVILLGERAFFGCGNLLAAELGDQITEIPACAFAECKNLVEVTLKSGLKILGARAFEDCERLIKIDLSYSTLTEIPSGAFFGCKSLLSITVPPTVLHIDDNAFGGCDKLVEIYNLSQRINLVKGSSLYGGIAMNAITIHLSVEEESILCEINGLIFCKSAEGGVLLLCTGEAQVTFPENFLGENYIISKDAFKDNSYITYIIFPEGVSAIEESAFENCNNLKKITFASGLVHVGNRAFYGCESLDEVRLPEGLESVGENSFSNCVSLKNIYISATVNEIHETAFRNCPMLESINVSDSSTVYAGIGNCLIYKEAGLLIAGCENSVIPSDGSVRGICAGAFAFTNISNVEIPSFVQNIEKYTFYNCTKLSSVVLNEGVISVGKKAFYGCTELVNLQLPTTLNQISESAFTSCVGLEYVKLPENLTELGGYVFRECVNLKSIEIPSSVNTVSDFCFDGCSSLVAVNLSEGLTEIGACAFRGTRITKIVIPASVVEIKYGALGRCKFLNSAIFKRRGKWRKSGGKETVYFSVFSVRNARLLKKHNYYSSLIAGN